ncbi:hypothetical protein C5167_015491 [Papaver somniferum]|uniref:Uncharacterized protein n=1 Tax=Papaver somniferum TaxID=3469 RepID=A0A4Y7JA40_PAPSO|nr:hypothetical protein C5167_015491 [Papaver somniferum]
MWHGFESGYAWKCGGGTTTTLSIECINDFPIQNKWEGVNFAGVGLLSIQFTSFGEKNMPFAYDFCWEAILQALGSFCLDCKCFLVLAFVILGVPFSNINCLSSSFIVLGMPLSSTQKNVGTSATHSQEVWGTVNLLMHGVCIYDRIFLHLESFKKYKILNIAVTPKQWSDECKTNGDLWRDTPSWSFGCKCFVADSPMLSFGSNMLSSMIYLLDITYWCKQNQSICEGDKVIPRLIPMLQIMLM